MNKRFCSDKRLSLQLTFCTIYLLFPFPPPPPLPLIPCFSFPKFPLCFPYSLPLPLSLRTGKSEVTWTKWSLAFLGRGERGEAVGQAPVQEWASCRAHQSPCSPPVARRLSPSQRFIVFFNDPAIGTPAATQANIPLACLLRPGCGPLQQITPKECRQAPLLRTRTHTCLKTHTRRLFFFPQTRCGCARYLKGCMWKHPWFSQIFSYT